MYPSDMGVVAHSVLQWSEFHCICSSKIPGTACLACEHQELAYSFARCKYFWVILWYCLSFISSNESETPGCQWLQCIVMFCFGSFIPCVNQICQTSVLPILVMKKGPSNVRISRGISIVNASVAGRGKNVKKVILFHYLLFLYQRYFGVCYIRKLYIYTDTVLHNLKVTDLNMDYTVCVFIFLGNR